MLSEKQSTRCFPNCSETLFRTASLIWKALEEFQEKTRFLLVKKFKKIQEAQKTWSIWQQAQNSFLVPEKSDGMKIEKRWKLADSQAKFLIWWAIMVYYQYWTLWDFNWNVVCQMIFLVSRLALDTPHWYLIAFELFVFCYRAKKTREQCMRVLLTQLKFNYNFLSRSFRTRCFRVFGQVSVAKCTWCCLVLFISMQLFTNIFSMVGEQRLVVFSVEVGII